MIKKFLRAWKWSGIAKYYHRNEFQEFLRQLKEYEKSSSLEPYERALKATALLMNDEYSLSEREFVILAQEIGNGSTAKDRYISIYASAMIDSINGRMAQYNHKKSEAEKINCGILHKKMLPL